MKIFSFNKKQKLTNSIRINEIYTNGKSFICYPLRIVYDIKDKTDDIPIKVLISVPKKRFKYAVDRNLLKRRIRESFRLKQHPLLNVLKSKDKTMEVTFNYVSNDILETSYIMKKMEKSLKTLINSLN